MGIDVESLVRLAVEKKGSDIHLVKGVAPKVRVDGRLVSLTDEILTDIDCISAAEQIAGDEYHKIEQIGQLDLSKTIAGERVRINLFRQQGAFSAAIRILSSTIPELRKLGLPKVVNNFETYQKGIVLVTGETGSGKSTTLAAILNNINHTRQEHIITLEDPIEYIYEPDQCIINQREIGTDTENYAEGLRAILREDPDIIMIGEMRDAETIETAITAAETGHLVFATLHTNSAADSIDRIVGTFPAEKHPQVRMQLSMTLRAILSQQLLVQLGGRGRVAACECMINTPAIQNLIREGKTPQILSAILSSSSQGSVTMDNCLIEMAQKNIISPETAIEAANDREFVGKKVNVGPMGMGGSSMSMSGGSRWNRI